MKNNSESKVLSSTPLPSTPAAERLSLLMPTETAEFEAKRQTKLIERENLTQSIMTKIKLFDPSLTPAKLEHMENRLRGLGCDKLREVKKFFDSDSKVNDFLDALEDDNQNLREAVNAIKDDYGCCAVCTCM
jgi:hypothetical protein